MSSYGSRNGYYPENFRLDTFYNPQTYKVENLTVPETYKATNHPVPQTFLVSNHPVSQTYKATNHTVPPTYKLSNNPVLQTYKTTNHPVPKTFMVTNNPVPQTYKATNHTVPTTYKLSNYAVQETNKATNHPFQRTYRVTNHPVIIRCRAESQEHNTSSAPLIKRKRYEVLKVVTNPQIVKQEKNLPLNVTNASVSKVVNNPQIVKQKENLPLNVINASFLKVVNNPQIVKQDKNLSLNVINASSDIKEEEGISNEQDDPNNNIPEVDIVITNVVSSFNLRCHLNLRHIGLYGLNVEYKRGEEVVYMKLRKPTTTAWIRSSGKVTCTGATSDDDAKKGSRKIARQLQQLGFGVRFCNFRIVNVMCTCNMHFGINLIKFAGKYKGLVVYEPELNPGATYRIKEPKATLKIFTSGNINVTAPSVRNAQLAIEHIYPLVEEFKTAKPPCNRKI